MRSQDRPVSVMIHDLGERLGAFRLSLNLRQEDLARKAGLSRPTIARLEAGRGASLETVVRVLKGLGLADRLDVLVPDARVRPMDAREDAQLRQRARAKPDDERPPQGPWQWGDEQ